MIEDMQLAGLSQGTQEASLRAVRQLAGQFCRSPDRLTERQLRDDLRHLRETRAVAKGTFQQHFFGIKFLFVNPLAYEWPRLTKKVRQPNRNRLPDVRSDSNCRRLITAIRQPIYRGGFALLYACGLRIGETVARVEHLQERCRGPSP